jgi:hypothetical protein
MKRYLLAAVLMSLPAGLLAETCLDAKEAVISAEAKCVDTGINIDYYGDQGVKVACLSDARVRSECGPDGHLTRLNAFTTWMRKAKEFEAGCLTQGGSFAYAEPNFTEPVDESFCLQAQPIVGKSMFEDALCNYRSVCPAVKVVCHFECRSQSQARAVSDAMNVSLRLQ